MKDLRNAKEIDVQTMQLLLYQVSENDGAVYRLGTVMYDAQYQSYAVVVYDPALMSTALDRIVWVINDGAAQQNSPGMPPEFQVKNHWSGMTIKNTHPLSTPSAPSGGRKKSKGGIFSQFTKAS